MKENSIIKKPHFLRLIIIVYIIIASATILFYFQSPIKTSDSIKPSKFVVKSNNHQEADSVLWIDSICRTEVSDKILLSKSDSIILKTDTILRIDFSHFVEFTNEDLRQILLKKDSVIKPVLYFKLKYLTREIIYSYPITKREKTFKNVIELD